MKPDDEFLPSNSNLESLVKRFEAMLANSENIFFDVEEFLDIISYYTDNYQYNKALQVISIAEKQYPFSTEILLLKANVFFKKDKKNEAEKILQEIEPLERQNPELYFLKGNILIGNGKISEAMAAYQQALAVSEEDKDTFLFSISGYLMSNNYFKEALFFFELLIDIGYDDEDIWYDISVCYEKTGDYEKSAQYMSKILNDNIFDEVTWDYLGDLYLKDNKQDKALEAYFYAFAIDADLYETVEKIAKILYDKQDWQAALKYYDFLKTKNPSKSTNYLIKIADIFLYLDETDTAYEYFLEVLKSEPKNPKAFYGISQIEFKKQNNNKALDMINVAMRYEKENTDFFYLRGKIYLSLRQDKKALNDFEKACNLSDDYDKQCRDYLLLLAEMEFSDTLELLSSLLHATKDETKTIIVDFLIQNQIFKNGEISLDEVKKFLITNILSKGE
ncbi:MAG TPA: hypothetical protein EYP87_02725 [Flavobacteriaceae bacterium]|nr:hypothetical protein [Flavobacteriaceae bacterium]